ncbi:hypothetical protein [Mesorhizobium sp. M1396]
MGHLKQDHRMGRNFLAFTEGDVYNAMLAEAAFAKGDINKVLRTR